MRIINGKFRAKSIPTPKNFRDRPTTNFAKEGLFQLLRNRYDLQSIDVLDLFSGSGSISYEFVSVGAKSVTAVEKNSNYARFTEKQIERFFPGELRVITADAYRILEKSRLDYDVIFADPPYNDPNIQRIPDLTLNNPHLKENALLIVEHSEDTDFSQHTHWEETRKYGKARFSFFKKT
jgi:16S rRNA (guanine966-N2)-methyltransferase